MGPLGVFLESLVVLLQPNTGYQFSSWALCPTTSLVHGPWTAGLIHGPTREDSLWWKMQVLVLLIPFQQHVLPYIIMTFHHAWGPLWRGLGTAVQRGLLVWEPVLEVCPWGPLAAKQKARGWVDSVCSRDSFPATLCDFCIKDSHCTALFCSDCFISSVPDKEF